MSLWGHLELLKEHWKGDDDVEGRRIVVDGRPAAAAGVPVHLWREIDLEQVLAALHDLEIFAPEPHTVDERCTVIDPAAVAVAVVAEYRRCGFKGDFAASTAALEGRRCHLVSGLAGCTSGELEPLTTCRA